MLKRLWAWLNPKDMTDAEIQMLNLRIAYELQAEPKNIRVMVATQERLDWVINEQLMGEPWGCAWPSGMILVRAKWKWILSHEIAHVYGADEKLARRFEDL